MEDFKNSEFYKGLPENVKEQLDKCETEEEAMDVLKHNMIETPDEALDDVAGGTCWGKYKCH